MSNVYWEVTGLDSLMHDLLLFGEKPSFRMVEGLELVMEQAFADTQEKTHIISGSLKASGKKATDWDGDSWTGTIEYGGVRNPELTPVPAPGYPPSQQAPKDPVDYAIYEMARGGEHDWFRDLPLFEPLFIEAVNLWPEEIE